jgi:16S rRNA (uracil1498-N3)-methyltransferase
LSTPPLFLIEQVPAVGESIRLDGAEGRHAADVRRIRVGETVLLGDGRGGVGDAVVTGAARGRLDLRLRRRDYLPEPPLRVVLAQALVKGDRGELAVELATEAGVDEVLPWRAARCVARWDEGPRGAHALRRWRSTAEQAAKQSRRAWIPRVHEPVDTAGLVERVRLGTAALLLDGSAGTPLRAVELPAEGELLLIAGPEGGVAPDEREALTAAGALPVRLGREVLRASTAGAVALGALGVLTDRW